MRDVANDLCGPVKRHGFGVDRTIDGTMDRHLSRVYLSLNTCTLANGQISTLDVTANLTADVDIAITDKIASYLQILADDRRWVRNRIFGTASRLGALLKNHNRRLSKFPDGAIIVL